ncbi:phage portal protein [Arcanobacterium buesumense]|uniref:phage portal protein n=1 Tax=Arcanobacterium buesumense TaxID=2722751 RepID=UPI001FFCDBF2|nr:phage portal protein [Arcanobacterium buesumense]
MKFNFEGLLRGKYKSRMDGYTVVRQNGWMSANDIRELETSTVSVNKLAGICIWLMATCFRSALLVHMPVPNQQSPNR